MSHYINDSLDRLVYGYKHKSNVPLHVSFGQPIERIAVGCGLEEDDWEELEGVGLKERTKVREEMEKRFRTLHLLRKRRISERVSRRRMKRRMKRTRTREISNE